MDNIPSLQPREAEPSLSRRKGGGASRICWNLFICYYFLLLSLITTGTYAVDHLHLETRISGSGIDRGFRRGLRGKETLKVSKDITMSISYIFICANPRFHILKEAKEELFSWFHCSLILAAFHAFMIINEVLLLFVHLVLLLAEPTWLLPN